MYIPHLLIDLKELREQTDIAKGKLIPAAQAVLFFHLLKKNLSEMNLKTIAEKTNYAQMTITRAAKKTDKKLIFEAGYSALARYTNLAEEEKNRFAISTVDYNYLIKNGKLQIIDKYSGAYTLEVWKYPPALLAKGRYVDPLSLYVIFKNDKDERVQMEIEKMVNRLW